MFSIYVNNITGSPFLTGLILSITTMAGIFLNIPFGIIEDRLNMKRVLQVTLLFYSGLALLYPQVSSFIQLLVLSVGRGIASSFLWLTSWAYVFTFAGKKAKGKETGFFSDMNDLASAVSPVIGGVASVASFFIPFYMLGLTSLIAFVVVSIKLRNIPKQRSLTFGFQMSKIAQHFRDSRFQKTVFLVVLFYALINVYYSFLSVFLNSEGVAIPFIGVILTVALLPAVSLEVPIGHMIDKHGIRKILSLAVVLTALMALMIPLFRNPYYLISVITLFTVSYTMIFIALYSRMSDIMSGDKTVMTGAIATFKDLGYTMGPLLAGWLIGLIGMQNTFLAIGGAFIFLLPVSLTLHD